MSKVQNAVLMWTRSAGERSIDAKHTLGIFLATNAARRLAMIDKCVSMKTFNDSGTEKGANDGKPGISRQFLYEAAGEGQYENGNGKSGKESIVLKTPSSFPTRQAASSTRRCLRLM